MAYLQQDPVGPPIRYFLFTPLTHVCFCGPHMVMMTLFQLQVMLLSIRHALYVIAYVLLLLCVHELLNALLPDMRILNTR